jgi:hypothetical protein
MLKAIFICALVAGVQGQDATTPKPSLAKCADITAQDYQKCVGHCYFDLVQGTCKEKKCADMSESECNPIINAITQKRKDQCMSVSARFSCSAKDDLTTTKSSATTKSCAETEVKDCSANYDCFMVMNNNQNACVEKSSLKCAEMNDMYTCHNMDHCHYKDGSMDKDGSTTPGTCIEMSSLKCADATSEECGSSYRNRRGAGGAFSECFLQQDDSTKTETCVEKSSVQCKDVDEPLCGTTNSGKGLDKCYFQKFDSNAPGTCVEKSSLKCKDVDETYCGTEINYMEGLDKCYFQKSDSNAPGPGTCVEKSTVKCEDVDETYCNSFKSGKCYFQKPDSNAPGPGTCVEKSTVKCEDLNEYQCPYFKSDSLACSYDYTSGACAEKRACSKLNYYDCGMRSSDDCRSTDLGYQCAEPKDVVCSTIREKSDCVFPCYYKDGNCVTAPPSK